MEKIEKEYFLVVDDSKTMRRIISMALTRMGVENIAEAEDGKEALKKLEQHPQVSIIISDWNMPNMNGLQFLEALRKIPKFMKTPFIMVTTENQQDNVVSAVQAGANNYMAKPFEESALQEKISQTLAKCRS